MRPNEPSCLMTRNVVSRKPPGRGAILDGGVEEGGGRREGGRILWR